MSAGQKHLEDQFQRIIKASHHDPFEILGMHATDGQAIVRAFIPDAREVRVAGKTELLSMKHVMGGIFEWRGEGSEIKHPYELRWLTRHGQPVQAYDPYTFPPQIDASELALFSAGKHVHAYRFLGAHARAVDGVEGVVFATWAPSAERVSVVGDFNDWDGRRHAMRSRGSSGVWEIFIPGVRPGTPYKFESRNRHDGSIHLRADPYARRSELRPKTASVIVNEEPYPWTDEAWMRSRTDADWLRQPMSIYEVHLGSWRRGRDGEFRDYRSLAVELVEYAKSLNYTHLELLPITEHPFDGSWGYQTTGFFAATSRFGPPDDLRFFINQCHENGIGVLLDWTPGHFPKDGHGLARFDGSALYEHGDPKQGEHPDWKTLIFNYGRNEVLSFLLSSANYWLEEYHFDGIRVDAVASMLHLDYSREPGQWTPNRYGGNENLEAVEFIKQLNTVLHERHPGALVIAEESTSWPMVSRPVYLGGLGFSMKWNMGWMNDTLEYMEQDPIYRHYHHDKLTFGLLYAYSENFLLPFSHDEVVHGKRSMLDKMPGDLWQRFANLRVLYTYMFTMSGKKLLFMGNEFAQGREWSHDRELDWSLLEYPNHRGIQKLVGDLNRLYCTEKALHRYEFEPRGFQWLDCHDSPQSVLTYLRKEEEEFVVVALNFTPVPRLGYRIGVPAQGMYREIFNSDSRYYEGSNMGNGFGIPAEERPWMSRPFSLSVTLPPLAGIILKPESSW